MIGSIWCNLTFSMLTFINSLINISNYMSNRLVGIKCVFLIIFSLLTAISPLLVFGQPPEQEQTKSRVYIIPIKEEITPGLARQVSAAMTEAEEWEADLIIIHMNTYGGLLDAADSIRTRLLNSEIPVKSFIDNNAASAGALISIACDEIYMREGASIGAATVVTQSAEALPDKYQSYMRSMMRSTAEKRGRDPKIAEAMVDPRTFIPNVSDSGQVLTFTTNEAIKNNYCEGAAESLQDVYRLSGITNVVETTYQPTFLEKVIGFLVNPAISGVLLLIIMGGIYFELQSPGIGFPLIASVIAATVYFAPLYLEGMAANWEILIAVAGFILILVEIIIIPGFGIAGVAGVLLLVSGFTFSLIGNDGFDFTFVPPLALVRALAMVLSSLILGVFISYFLAKRLLKTSRFGKLVLSESMLASDGYISSDNKLSYLVGKSGLTLSELRPSGKLKVEDQSYTASALRGFIEKGREVDIVKFDGITLWVKKK